MSNMTYAPRIGSPLLFTTDEFSPGNPITMRGVCTDIRAADGEALTSDVQDRVAFVAVLGHPNTFSVPVGCKAAEDPAAPAPTPKSVVQDV